MASVVPHPDFDCTDRTLQNFVFGNRNNANKMESRPVSPADVFVESQSFFDDNSSDVSVGSDDDSDESSGEELAEIVSELDIRDLSNEPNNKSRFVEIMELSHDINKNIVNNYCQKPIIDNITQYITVKDLSIIAACVILALKDFNTTTPTYVALNPIYTQSELTMIMWHYSGTHEDTLPLASCVDANLDVVKPANILRLTRMRIERYVSNWEINDGSPVNRMKMFSEGKMMVTWNNSRYGLWF